MWISSPALWPWRKRLFQPSRGRFLISSGVKQTSSHLLICTDSDLTCLHFLSQVNPVQPFKLPSDQKSAFVIYIFIQQVRFTFLLHIEDYSSSFFILFLISGSGRKSQTVDLRLHLGGEFHTCFSKEQHSIARQKNNIWTTDKHPIPFTSTPSLSILGRRDWTKGLNARVGEKEEDLNGCLLINDENSLTL